MELSIIIPVYNVEEYIEKCVKSVISKDLLNNSNYEIIIINDGTQDDSIKMINHLNDDKNIRIINQDNSGLGAARNKGLEYAKGRYVWFIDSDDFIEDNAIPDLLEYLHGTDSDLIEIRYRKVFEDERTPVDSPYRFWDDCISSRDVMKSGGLSTPAQFTIYNRNLLNRHSLRFTTGIFHEDSEFKPRVLYFANKCSQYDKLIYNYLQRRNGSITSKFNIKRAKDSIIVMENLFEFCRKYCRNSVIEKRYFYSRISLTYNSLLQGIKLLKTDEAREMIDILSLKHHLIECLICSRKLKYILEGLLLFLNFNFSIQLYNRIFK